MAIHVLIFHSVAAGMTVTIDKMAINRINEWEIKKKKSVILCQDFFLFCFAMLEKMMLNYFIQFMQQILMTHKNVIAKYYRIDCYPASKVVRDLND